MDPEPNAAETPGTGANVNLDWRDNLPDDLKSHPSLEKFKSPVDVVKSYIEMQRFIGRDKVPVPPKDSATKEDWDVVFNALGRPESPDGYEIDLSKYQDDEEFNIDENVLSEFKQKAYEIGLLPAQAQEIVDWFMKSNKTALDTIAQQQEEEYKRAETELRKAWGQAYEDRLKRVQTLVKSFADEDAVVELAEKFGNNPKLIKFLYNIAEKISPDVLGGKTSSMTKTPEEIRKEILAIKSDPKHPLNDQFHPEHKAAVEYVQNLYKMMEAG